MAFDHSDSIEIDVSAARDRWADGVHLVDVREPSEHSIGVIPGSILLSAGVDPVELCRSLHMDKGPGIVICASGVRSVACVRALVGSGIEGWTSLIGGLDAWKSAGFDVKRQPDDRLTEAQISRYSRQLLLPEIGVAGQHRLLASRVLIVGAGGLGSPVIQYLAAAGVGTLGIADDDRVDVSNLHRQVVHDTQSIGEWKVVSAARRARSLNPDVTTIEFANRVSAATIDAVLDERWDVIVDCSDSFDTRYLVGDAATHHQIPLVHGSVYRSDGQVAVFDPPRGPCYRCLFPERIASALAPSCAEAGVLGVLPGIIGTMQATETIKLLLGIPSRLRGGLLLYDAMAPHMDIVRIPRRQDCHGCGDSVPSVDI